MENKKNIKGQPLNPDTSPEEIGRQFLKELKAQGPSTKKIGQTFIIC
tara:strand:- start:2525 stop:2665 length:141 start_codon:yes stop_codon:yes gene_type:complete